MAALVLPNVLQAMVVEYLEPMDALKLVCAAEELESRWSCRMEWLPEQQLIQWSSLGGLPHRVGPLTWRECYENQVWLADKLAIPPVRLGKEELRLFSEVCARLDHNVFNNGFAINETTSMQTSTWSNGTFEDVLDVVFLQPLSWSSVVSHWVAQAALDRLFAGRPHTLCGRNLLLLHLAMRLFYSPGLGVSGQNNNGYVDMGWIKYAPLVVYHTLELWPTDAALLVCGLGSTNRLPLQEAAATSNVVLSAHMVSDSFFNNHTEEEEEEELKQSIQRLVNRTIQGPNEYAPKTEEMGPLLAMLGVLRTRFPHTFGQVFLQKWATTATIEEARDIWRTNWLSARRDTHVGIEVPLYAGQIPGFDKDTDPFMFGEMDVGELTRVTRACLAHLPADAWLRHGDTVRFLDMGEYRNEGVLMWDAHAGSLVHLDTARDEYGAVPSCIHIDQVASVDFFRSTIAHNTLVWLDVGKYEWHEEEEEQVAHAATTRSFVSTPVLARTFRLVVAAHDVGRFRARYFRPHSNNNNNKLAQFEVEPPDYVDENNNNAYANLPTKAETLYWPE